MAQNSTKDQWAILHLWTFLVLSWCGANRTIWNCWKSKKLQLFLRFLQAWPFAAENQVWKWMKTNWFIVMRMSVYLLTLVPLQMIFAQDNKQFLCTLLETVYTALAVWLTKCLLFDKPFAFSVPQMLSSCNCGVMVNAPLRPAFQW